MQKSKKKKSFLNQLSIDLIKSNTRYIENKCLVCLYYGDYKNKYYPLAFIPKLIQIFYSLHKEKQILKYIVRNSKFLIIKNLLSTNPI